MKRIFAVLLTVFILISFSGCSLFNNEQKNKEKEYKEKYEQALALLEEKDEIGAYKLLFQVKEYAPAQNKINELLENDFSLQYRAAEVGFSVKFGIYEQDNNTTNGKEHIEWTVIKKDNGKLMLLSNNILDYHRYYTETPDKYTWLNSELCSWLNGEFFTSSFLETEQSKIVSTSVTTYEPDLKDDQTGNCKVFLLSKEEYYAFDYSSIRSKYIDKIQHSTYSKEKYLDYAREELSGVGSNSVLPTNHFALRDCSDYGLYYLYTNSKGNPTLGNNGSRRFDVFNVRPVIWIKY